MFLVYNARCYNLMRNGKRFLILALYLCPILLAFGLYLTRTKRAVRRTETQLQAVNAHFAPILNKWKSVAFVPIEDNQTFWDEINSITVLNEAELDQRQKQQLQETLKNYILAYHIGTFEAFHKFRAPVPEFQLATTCVDYLNHDLQKDNQVLPHDQESVFALWWNKYVGNQWENFWVGIALTNASVEVQVATNDVGTLDSYVLKRQNAGFSKTTSIIAFGVTPDTILRKNGKVYYATTSLLPRNNDATYPVFCRFYWAEVYGKWLPLEQVGAYSGPRKQVLLF